MKKTTMMILASFLFLISCGEPQNEKKNRRYVISYLKGEVLVNEKPATIQTTIMESDSVTTREASYAIIKLADHATITIKPKTKIYFSLLSDQGKTEIFQEDGSTFSKVKTGTEYRIKTATVVAGVRGTSFEVTSNKNSTSISLLEGKVEAKNDEQVEVIEIGQKLVSIRLKKMEKSELTQKEINVLRVEQSIATSVKTDNSNEITNEIAIAETKQKEAVNEIASKNQASTKMTLAEIKQKFGRIANVITKSGKTYQGYFNQSGDTMTIITINGKVIIKVTDVSKVIPIS